MSHLIMLGREPNTDGWHYLGTVSGVEDHEEVPEALITKRSEMYRLPEEKVRKDVEFWQETRIIKTAVDDEGDIDEKYNVDMCELETQ